MPSRRRTPPSFPGLALLALLFTFTLPPASARAQCPTLPIPGTFAGDTDFQTVKSQMWINGATWWGAFSDGSSGVYFYQKSGAGFVKGALIDGNPIAQADTLWNGAHLFVLMFHSGSLAKFYKYTYNAGSQTYALVPGFPVNLPLTGMATHAVMAQDSTGKLWATYTGSGSGLGGDGQVHVIWSTNAAHTAWNTTGFILESGLTPFTTEVSAIVAFGGDKVGVFWSNQALGEDGFRVHNDADPETTWGGKEIVDSGQGIPGIADDHASIAAAPDGRVFVVTKDGILDGHLNLYVRGAAGGWSPKVQVNNDPGAIVTRPILMLDTESSRAYVIYRNTALDPGVIQISGIDMNSPTAFGPACPFIASQKSNNPTGTKQHLNHATGLVAVSSQDGQILHQTLDLSAPPTASFNASATGGSAPLAVNFTDTSTDDVGVVSWSWNFGDGYTSNIQNPSHVFRAGVFNVSLQVVDASGNATTANQNINVTDANVPVIQNVSPALVVFNSGSFTLTVDGADFNAGSQIRIDGSPRTTTVVNATRVTAVMPATDSQTLGAFPITVVNSGGASNAVNLVVTADAPLPHVTSITPVERLVGSSAFTLTVNGADFSSTSKVFWNNSERPTTFVSATQLTAQISAADQAAVAYEIPVYVVTPAPGGGQSPETRFFNIRPICATPPTPIQFTGSTEFNTVKSQMWHHDGTWWGVFSDIDATGVGTGLSIYKKSGSAMNKGQLVDPNVYGLPDVLWDGANLFVMVLEAAAEGTPVAQQEAKLYKFTYNPGPQDYTLLAGFPVTIPLHGLAASLHFDKDGTGKLWATYTGTNVDLGVGDRNVRVIWSTNAAHTAWNSDGFLLETNLTALTTEVSAIIPFGGNKVGVTWSNQELDEYGFRFHTDGDPETDWSAKEIIDDGTLRIDDHISMKSTADGRVFMVAKDGIGDGHLQLYIRSAAGVWSERIPVNLDPNVFATRPVTVIDTTNNMLYVVYRDSNSILLYSRMPLSTTSFDPACPFIADAVNNPTSTKQPINGVTELHVAARGGGPILLGRLDLPGGAPPAGPSITSLAPASVLKGGAAFTLTVNGTGFVSGATVSVGGANRTTTFVSATQLTAQILASDIANAGTFPVRVTNPAGGGASPTLDLVVTNPAPLLTGVPPLSPATATAGTGQFTLTLNGSNFVPNSVVRWNGATAAADRPTTFVSANQLQATISADDIATGGLRPVRVFNPGPGGGASGAQTFTVNNPVPSAASMSPATACNGGGAFTLTVNGTGFVSGAVVRWNGANRTTTFFSPTELHAQINAADIAAAGAASVTVFNPTPGGGASAPALSFVITGTCSNPVPVVNNISPSTRDVASGAFTVTVNGSDFVANSVVRFNGIDRTTVFVSPTQLTAQILASDIAVGGLYPISVFTPTPGGGTSGSVNLTVNNPAPTLASIFPPTKEIAASSLSLVCNGTNFVSDSVGRFNGSQRATIFLSPTQIEMQLLPADITVAGSFPITVSNPAPGGGTSGSVSLTLNNPAPTLIGPLAPQSVAAGSGAVTVNVPGEGFYAGSVVRFNGTNAAADRPTTFVSSELLQVQLTAADVSAGGVFPIVVFNATPGGGASNALDFTVGNPLPVLDTISPTSRAAGAGQFTLTVNGSGFSSGSVVTFNGNNMATAFVSATQLTATIPAAETAAAGAYPVRVFTPAPGGGLSAATLDFAVTNPAPTVTGISPTTRTAGAGEFTLTVNGANFLATSVVRLNGADKATTFVSATQLQATIPAADTASGGTLPVAVFNPAPGGGTSAQAISLTVNNPAPSVTGISPTSATTGGAQFTLTVNGTDFVAGSVVRVNGNDRPTTFVSATQLTATIPAADIAAAGTLAISVFTPTPGGGASGAVNLVVETPNPFPAVTTLSPASVTAGAADFTLTVNGSDFVSGAVVRWNGSDRATTFVNSTQLTAQIAAADVAAAGDFAVTVFNPAPGGGTSGAVSFTVNPQNPVIGTLSPASVEAGGGEFTLTVNGSNFLAGSVVRFNGADRTTTFVSPTQLTAQITAADIAAGGVFAVTVSNPAPGGTSNEASLTVNNPAPTLNDISPASGLAGGAAFTLTVNGSGFVPASVVRWDGAARATTFVSSTQLQAAITAADIAAAGSASVTVFNATPGGGESGAASFAVDNPAPAVGSLSPSSAVAGGAAFTLTVNGSNFIGASVVRLNGADRTTTFVSAAQLTAQILASDIAAPGSFSVTVFNPAPGGGASPAQAFEVLANPRVVRVVAASAAPNTTLHVPVEFDAQGDENAVGFSLSFDAALLSNPQAALGSGAGGATLNVNDSQTALGRYGVVVSLPSGQTFPAGARQLLVVSFTTAGTPADTQVGFADQPVLREVSNMNADPLPAVYVPQTVSILTGYEGDVAPRPGGNANGTVSIADWVQVGRFAAGLDTAAVGSEFQRADCAPRTTFGNGAVSVADWVQAGRYAAGLDLVVPAAGPTGPTPAAPAEGDEAFTKSSPEFGEALAEAAASVVRFVGAAVPAGGGGAVGVVLDARGDENALGFTLSFDPSVLRFVSAAAGEDAGGATLNVNADKAAEGRVGFALALPAGRTFPSGERRLFVIDFAAVSGADTRTLLRFEDDLAAREVADANARSLASDFRSGSVGVEADAARPPSVQFGAASYSGVEGGGPVVVTVTRAGDLSGVSRVNYRSADAAAVQKSDYTAAAGVLTFAPGEERKTLSVLLNDDAYAEGSEVFGLSLFGPTGAVLGPRAAAAVSITDDDTVTGLSSPYADDAEAFVRQHYHDFLGREPDAEGLRFWAGQIEACGEDSSCRDEARVNVSAAFFLSVEFQQTGFLAYRLAEASFDRAPRFLDFVRDAHELGRGVVVGRPGWERQLEENRRAFVEAWADGPAFRSRYEWMTNREYVETLFRNAGVASADVTALAAGLERGAETRASVLLKVAEGESFKRREFNRAFVLMQYFGYLRRDPDGGPDSNLDGYNYWLRKLDEHGGDFRRADMVRAFLLSGEHRARFGP